MAIVKGKKLDINQTGMEMIKDHIDNTGKVWVKGTRYQPSSAGNDYQEIIIKGDCVIFNDYPL